ncbi:MAG: ribonuclease HII [Bacteriovoracaceae bacterium]
MKKIDESFYYSGLGFIGGCDEVGRGPLAGPVVSCSVFLHDIFERPILLKDLRLCLKNLMALGVCDSKMSTKAYRHLVLEELGTSDFLSKSGTLRLKGTDRVGISYHISEVNNHKIDEINIFQASLLSMKRCINKGAMNREGEGIMLVDGKYLPTGLKKNISAHAIIKGDSKSLMIGLASFLAKSYRDMTMEKWARQYPGYGFERNAGYPTAGHKEAISVLGPTPIHRSSFRGVKEHLESGHI